MALLRMLWNNFRRNTVSFLDFKIPLSPYTRVYPKVSGLAAWSENCKWYSSLPLNAVYRYFVSQSSEFCRHNPLCCFWTSVCFCSLFRYLFRYRLSHETFGYTLVYQHYYDSINFMKFCMEAFPEKYESELHFYSHWTILNSHHKHGCLSAFSVLSSDDRSNHDLISKGRIPVAFRNYCVTITFMMQQ
jgi:hypothetical protein